MFENGLGCCCWIESPVIGRRFDLLGLGIGVVLLLTIEILGRFVVCLDYKY